MEFLSSLEQLSKVGVQGLLLIALMAIWRKLDKVETTAKQDYEKHIEKYEALLERFIKAME